MILTRSLADNIVQKTKELTALHMNVMDANGIIISSSDHERIGTFHEGAAKAIQNGVDQIITEEIYQKMIGTKPGINMPIRFDDMVIGVIGITGDPDQVQPFGKAVQMMTELMLQQAFLSEQVGNEEKARDFLVQDLIAGQNDRGLDAVIARGQLLGVDLTLPRSAWVIQTENSDKQTETLEIHRSLVRKISNLFPNPRQILCSRVQRNRWVIITEMQPLTDRSRFESISNQIRKLISERMSTKAYLTVGRQVPGADALHVSYKEALTLLKINRLFPENAAVKHFYDLGLELMCAEVNASTRAHIIDRSLGALPDFPDLMETLNAFLNCSLNIASAAKMLCIHRNTLLYRLDRIKEISGNNPRNFDQAAQMHVALLLVRMK
ncbi:CdaR family transcriptional regulator [Paenibacillus sp. D9]|uniref:CdaR family transcriptional regulator n=1 Tax=Paenibacillus TaxID=44249 RepID=UPI000AF5E932|nr:sugar diacid recognition domain-containing protein [Paenibacillus sp. D9]